MMSQTRSLHDLEHLELLHDFEDLEERFADAEQKPNQASKVLLLAKALAELEKKCVAHFYWYQSSCSTLKECFVSYQSRLQELREFAVTQLLDDSSQPSPHQQLSTLGITTRRDAKAFIRAAICENDISAVASFDALWKELESTPDEQLATKVFTTQAGYQPLKNKMLQQVPALYCKAYQRELRAEQQQILSKAIREQKLAELINDAEDKSILLAKNVERRIQDCRKINNTRKMYGRLVAEFEALQQSVDACVRIVSEVNVEELEEQYRRLMELYEEGSRISMLSHLDSMNDNGRALDILRLNQNAKDEDCSRKKRETDIALDIQELNKHIKDLEGCSIAFAAQCDVIAEYEKEEQSVNSRINKLTRDREDELVEISSQFCLETEFWNEILVELQREQVDGLREFVTQKLMLQSKRNGRELDLRISVQALQLPHVLSLERDPELKEEKEEKDFKGSQESKHTASATFATVLSPIEFVKSLMPSQQIVDECASAANTYSDKSLSEIANILAAQFRAIHDRYNPPNLLAQIHELKRRNEQLEFFKRTHKPRKPSPKKWLGIAVSISIAIVVGACLIGVLSNPIGWSVGAQIAALMGLCYFARKAYSSAKYAYAMHKRKKLLEKNNKPEYVQALLEDQDDALEKKSNCFQTHTTAKVREMLIEHSILVHSVNKSLATGQPSSSVTLSRRGAELESCSLLRDKSDTYKNIRLFNISYYTGETTMSYERNSISGPELVPADHAEFEAALQPVSRQIASPAA